LTESFSFCLRAPRALQRETWSKRWKTRGSSRISSPERCTTVCPIVRLFDRKKRSNKCSNKRSKRERRDASICSSHRSLSVPEEISNFAHGYTFDFNFSLTSRITISYFRLRSNSRGLISLFLSPSFFSPFLSSRVCRPRRSRALNSLSLSRSRGDIFYALTFGCCSVSCCNC